MIIFDEFGRWKCIMNLYVEGWEDWISSSLMESLNVCISYVYRVKMVWMPPMYVVMILMDNEYENNKFGLEM